MALFHTTVLDNQIKALDTIGSVSGSIATFETDRAERLVNLEVAITATGGGGTPDAPIAINGFSQANIVNMSDITNKAYFEGLLNGTYGFVDLGSLSWSKDTTTRPADGATIHAWYTSISYIKRVPNTNIGNVIVFGYDTDNVRNVDYGGYDVVKDKIIGGGDNNSRFWIYNSAYSEYNSTQFKTAMNGVYLIYELATPTTPTITKAQFETLLSAFSINGSIDTITFGQTVYGATLDPLSGKLTITHAIKTFDGSESFAPMSGQRCAIAISGIKVNPLSQIDDLICSHYKSDVQGASGDKFVYKAGENTAVVFCDTVHCVDVATFQAYLANQYSNGTPVQLVYWLATPIEIQLDSKQIQAIIGTNNIYSDTGDIIDLKFVLSVGQAIS